MAPADMVPHSLGWEIHVFKPELQHRRGAFKRINTTAQSQRVQ